MKREVLTLVTEAQAKPGIVFRVKITPKCFLCPLYSLCVSKLKEGVKYKVKNVRNHIHFCKVIGEKMYVALVEEMPITVSLEAKKAVEGIVTSYTTIKCTIRECKYSRYCTSVPIENNTKIRVLKVKEKVSCPRSLSLQLAEVEPLS